MDVIIRPGRLSGTVAVPPSKSQVHRLLIMQALCGYLPRDVKEAPALCDDTEATADSLEALFRADVSSVIDCKESGSTLRFLLPIAGAVKKTCTFTGEGRLKDRPIEELMELLSAHGLSFDKRQMPFTVSGALRPGKYCISGNVSSQYISGLLMALPILDGQSEICLSSPLESSGYVELTISMLREFGISVKETDTGWVLDGGQMYSMPASIRVEGDWSSAAPFSVANYLGSHVELAGLEGPPSLQRDRDVDGLLLELGGHISLKDCPDLGPALAAAALGHKGTTTLTNTRRLRFKESDRVKAIVEMVNALGGKAKADEDSITVTGTGVIEGGTVDSFRDHRIIMAAAVAAASAICKGPVRINDAQFVSKSYPSFFEDLMSLGGDVHVV